MAAPTNRKRTSKAPCQGSAVHTWLVQLLSRRATKVATVALANKTARMAWKIMTSGERYREPLVQPA